MVVQTAFLRMVRSKAFCAAIFFIIACSVEEKTNLKHMPWPVKNLSRIHTFTPTCSYEMTRVKGNYCSFVDQRCKTWLDPHTIRPRFRRCKEYYPVTGCSGKSTPMDFCIDMFEFKERSSDLPMSNVSWTSAKEICEDLGKRLCTTHEWTLACEGPQWLPHPYGLIRNHETCYTDKLLLEMVDKKGKLIDHRLSVNTHPQCISPFGVRNMVGNVGEWTFYEKGTRPKRAGGQGGWWSSGLRSRCRPITHGHDEYFAMVQIGFRCCDNVELR